MILRGSPVDAVKGDEFDALLFVEVVGQRAGQVVSAVPVTSGTR